MYRISTVGHSSRVVITSRTLSKCFGPLSMLLVTHSASNPSELHEIQRNSIKSIDFPILDLHRDYNGNTVKFLDLLVPDRVWQSTLRCDYQDIDHRFGVTGSIVKKCSEQIFEKVSHSGYFLSNP